MQSARTPGPLGRDVVVVAGAFVVDVVVLEVGALVGAGNGVVVVAWRRGDCCAEGWGLPAQPAATAPSATHANASDRRLPTPSVWHRGTRQGSSPATVPTMRRWPNRDHD